MKIEKNKFIGISIIIISLLVSLFLFFSTENTLRWVSAYGLVISIFMSLLYAKINGKFLTPFMMFYFAFSIFQFGQFYLYALNIDYDYVFLHSFYGSFCSYNDVITVAKFTILSIQLLMLAGILTSNRVIANINNIDSNMMADVNATTLKNTAKLMFWVSFPCSAIMTVVEVTISVLYGYSGIRNGNTAGIIASLGLFNKISVFYVPALILSWIVYRDEKGKQKIYELLIVIHALAYLVVGQRTVGIAMAMVYVLLKVNNGEKVKRKNIVIVAFAFISLMIISNYVGNSRSDSSVSFNLFDEISSSVINFVGNCGWSCFPFMVIVGACPNSIPFSKGYSYIVSVLGFIPSFIDPTGTVNRIISSIDETWLTNFTGVNFGIGYSLTAEAYYNFAWCGLIAIFVISLLISKYLNKDVGNTSTFQYYVQMSLTYALFTLPRRGIFAFFNYLFYYVFVFWIVNKAFINFRSHR